MQALSHYAVLFLLYAPVSALVGVIIFKVIGALKSRNAFKIKNPLKLR